MKRKSIIALVISCLGLGAVTTSCEDILSPDSERHAYEVAQDTLYSYWGILRSLQNVGERYVILGECRGDLVDGTSHLSDSISNILNFDMEHALDGSNRYLQVSDYYHVINSCNAYMASCDKERVTGTLQPYMMKEYAQVCAIRAWVYLQLVQVYGEVPFYTQPLITTDDINNFMADANHQMANADNLADLLAPELEQMYEIERTYGFPQYDNYGRTNVVCHSQKCMIPVSLILGDLYLTQGSSESCKKAAQWYYNYLSPQDYKNAGGPLPSNYYSYGYQTARDDKPRYFNTGTPWTEKGQWSKTAEAISAIPSSTNKLWGTVQRGVNELFGFASEIRVSTGGADTSTVAGINLTPQYDVKQLRASDGYFAQCKAVPYECYEATSSADVNSGTAALIIDTLVGDARRSWVVEYNQEYDNGVSNFEYFVTKQNPRGAYTTVYPMIYRKSMVWLRFAEAINRAGFPAYAFAVLKNGICSNTNWFPNSDEHFAIKDTIYTNAIVSFTLANNKTRRDTITSDVTINHKADFETLAQTYIDDVLANDAGELKPGAVPTVTYNTMAGSLYNYTDENKAKDIVCDYISYSEYMKAKTFTFMNFNNSNFDAGSTNYLAYRISSTEAPSVYNNPNANSVTIGIHYHGAGLIRYNEKRSTYNYVDKIAEVAKKNYGVTMNKDDIYSDTQNDLIIKCVEDLIVDEEAMELAFEGTRFFDLMRVAHRRGDTSYLAERVSKRTGTKDANLYSKLLSTDNWYFPLPRK